MHYRNCVIALSSTTSKRFKDDAGGNIILSSERYNACISITITFQIFKFARHAVSCKEACIPKTNESFMPH